MISGEGQPLTQYDTSEPAIPIGLVRGFEQPEIGKKIELWIGFRGEDRYPATPVIEITEVIKDEAHPGALRFTGIEVAQYERYGLV